ncbi:SWI/SNF-related matrix-associated actin-dependent regulator of chromatin subfamily A-like protein [Quillaja saponaria]|uniref:SWI/SNF-related matrix-associated actin-dependent regulator of chromatin subfamily A-like protein n=1 Tax=Quillaja saponaria TaxID=32244 RepID=A0AAD7PSN7_QUISA|nr:SWI/SNF-related matrix-associated actin-dependent regulator of chromatin subfamily A-like protein [Quillaja saponaria]
MSNTEAHSPGNIPFSWENKPGICKVTHHGNLKERHEFLPEKLPPPPCPSETAKISVLVHDIQIPLPPCAFQAPYRSSSKKGLKIQEDPFLAAYKECTKSHKSSGKIITNKLPKIDVGSGVRKSLFVFSCKRSCSVRDDNLVRISQLPFNVDN